MYEMNLQGVEFSQAFNLFLGVLVIAFALLMLIIIVAKGYRMGHQYIHFNMAFTTTSISLFGAALGLLLIVLLSSTNYVFDIPIFDSDFADMFVTIGVIAFISSIIAVTFLLYTKRGGY